VRLCFSLDSASELYIEDHVNIDVVILLTPDDCLGTVSAKFLADRKRNLATNTQRDKEY
jgi:hypothetical protein